MQTKICPKCKIEKPISEFSKSKTGKYGVRADCKSCRNKYNKQWREINHEHKRQWRKENKEKIAEHGKQYRQENKEKIAEYKKQWREKNPEYHKEYYKIYRAENSYNLNKYSSIYYKTNKQYFIEYCKKYRQTEKGKAIDKATKHNRRAYKLQNGGKHTAKQILELFDLQSGKCVYCNIELSLTKNNKFHVDHIVPLSKGGSNDISNIQLLCPKCNLSKHDKLPEEFAANFGKLL